MGRVSTMPMISRRGILFAGGLVGALDVVNTFHLYTSTTHGGYDVRTPLLSLGILALGVCLWLGGATRTATVLLALAALLESRDVWRDLPFGPDNVPDFFSAIARITLTAACWRANDRLGRVTPQQDD